MGIGGLDTEFSSIFRRAFASRVFPPGLVEKLGIQHVKGKPEIRAIEFILITGLRYIAAWSTGYWKDAIGASNRQDA